MIKKIAAVFLFLGISSTTLLANTPFYIKLGATNDSEKAAQIKQNLSQRGYNVKIQKQQNSQVLFVGPYTNDTAASKQLTTLRQNYPNSYVIKTDLSGNSKFSISSERSFFITAALGYHKGEAKCSNLDESLEFNTPSSSGLSYGLGVGYDFDPYWVSLEYAQLNSGDLELSNIFISLNHNFYATTKTTFFAGGLLGTSSLDYSSALYEGTTTSGSSSLMLGVQTGARYKLDIENLWLYTTLSYSILDHQTNFDFGGNIRHSSLTNAVIGIGYSF